jgi:hypothetical protein
VLSSDGAELCRFFREQGLVDQSKGGVK